MDFNNNIPIYIQIYNEICEKVLSQDYLPESRLESVREYGAKIGVNPNTIARSYEKLTTDGIIYNKRGIGYFVSPEAPGIILERYRKDFLENEVPQLLRKMKLLNLDPKEVF